MGQISSDLVAPSMTALYACDVWMEMQRLFGFTFLELAYRTSEIF
jgi:hypothetical protein